MNNYPIIPGLGNLQGRLAFNNSYFLYPALLNADFGFISGKGYHLASGLLLLALFVQILQSLFKVFKKKTKIRLYDLFNIIFFYPVLTQGLNIYYFSSPSPDIPLFILIIILGSRLFLFLEEESLRKKENLGLIIILLAFVGITLKLSFLAFGIATFLLVFLVWFYQVGLKSLSKYRKTFLSMMLIGVLSFGIWLARGIILSGYLVYPSPFFSFAFEWQIPKASVVFMSRLIQGWARLPGPDWAQGLTGWTWMGSWLNRLISKMEMITLMVMTITSFITLALINKKSSLATKDKQIWLFFLPVITTLTYWFFLVPDLRFGRPYFWLLGAGAAALAIKRVISFKKLKKKILNKVLLIYIFFTLFELLIIGEKNFIVSLYKGGSFNEAIGQLKIKEDFLVTKPGKDKGFYPAPEVELNQYLTDSGLVIFYPGEDNQCWDRELLCTPYPSRNLALREKGRLRRGFKVIPKDDNLFVGVKP